jgi:hypothetical protein
MWRADRRFRHSIRHPLVLILTACWMLPGLANAQYFGRNKVIWDELNFEILESDHFKIYYYPPDARETADYVAKIAERWYDRYSRVLDHELSEKKSLIVYQDQADFQQTVVTSGLISQATGGFTESQQDRVVLPLTGINADNDHVIGHELVHVFEFDMSQAARRKGGSTNAESLPLWAVEGLAEYLSQGRVDPDTAMQVRDLVLHDRLPDMGAFLTRMPSPYQYGQAVWAYVAGRWGDDAVRRLFAAAATSGVDRAIDRVLGLKADEFWDDLNESLQSTDQPILDDRDAPGDAASPMLTAKTTDASVNMAPSLSPDGRFVAFLSTRELAVELYLADAETGHIIRKLVSAETDPHFDELSFLDSSAAWSPDGRRLAFSVFAEGERRIAIYDLDKKAVVQRLDLKGIKGMRDASWSPDGASLVFSAARTGGASDLYRVDVATGELTRLTNDGYSAIQPEFSPDGRTIAFVTDRGPKTDLDELRFGPLQIALLDVASGEIRTLDLFAQGKHIDPHFTADGSAIYFIAEPDGVPDIYRYAMRDRRISRITRLKTGVAGLTGTSPALSLSRSGTLAFSVLDDAGWSIYRLETAGGKASAPPEPGDFIAAVLPPTGVEDEPVQIYLANAEQGLIGSTRDYPTRAYESKLKFSTLGPASIGIATGGSLGGTSLSGGLSAYFNDPLNRHQLVTSFQGGSTQGNLLSFKDSIGLGIGYLNQTHRFQWGVTGSHEPYLRVGAAVGREPVEIDSMSVPADIVQRSAQIMTVDEGAVFGQYPLSRNNRFEFEAGRTHIGFDQRVEQLIYPDGYSPFRRDFSLPAPQPLDLESQSVAFVRDTSRWGIVSPIDGARFRVETSYTRGDLSYRTTTLDYRHYFFHRPLTYALRILQVGRRGMDSEDPRLPSLDVGRNTLVRGYELGSIDPSECTFVSGAGNQTCPEIDRLIGSRIAVVNFELRLPLSGNEDFGLFDFPAAPTELAFFVDIGAAWSAGQTVDWTFDRHTTRRVPVVSSGLAVRTVVLGSLPLEFYYAWPYQRPQEDRVFGFMINVGW